jgi:serine/threonine protein kinase
MVHRDVRPAHLLLDRFGTIKVIDLGLAQYLQAPPTPGTAPAFEPAVADYVSPEQASGNGAIDHRTDVYSLGATLYFLLTGRTPFQSRRNHSRGNCSRTSSALRPQSPTSGHTYRSRSRISLPG